MEINYIVLAHKQPEQVYRLVNILDSIDCNFYIHVNKAQNINPFKESFLFRNNIHFINDERREYSNWGDIGIVKATIRAFEQIVLDKRKGFCILLSGQDYPIKSNSYIKTFLKDNASTNFISIFPFPATCWPDGGMPRLYSYKINKTSAFRDYVVVPSVFDSNFYNYKAIKKCLSLVLAGNFRFISKIFKKRSYPSYLKPYGGDFWCALPIETVTYILDFLSKHKDYLTYHQDSLLPDETFFHSIIMKLASINKNINIKPTLTYVRWASTFSSSPVTFTAKDINELQQVDGNKLFARKFDSKADEAILDMAELLM